MRRDLAGGSLVRSSALADSSAEVVRSEELDIFVVESVTELAVLETVQTGNVKTSITESITATNDGLQVYRSSKSRFHCGGRLQGRLVKLKHITQARWYEYHPSTPSGSRTPGADEGIFIPTRLDKVETLCKSVLVTNVKTVKS